MVDARAMGKLSLGYPSLFEAGAHQLSQFAVLEQIPPPFSVPRDHLMMGRCDGADLASGLKDACGIPDPRAADLGSRQPSCSSRSGTVATGNPTIHSISRTARAASTRGHHGATSPKPPVTLGARHAARRDRG